MDTQIWYAIYSTIFGGIIGAFSHLGEVSSIFTVVFDLVILFLILFVKKEKNVAVFEK